MFDDGKQVIAGNRMVPRRECMQVGVADVFERAREQRMQHGVTI
jgi:hypothetical protein